MVRISLILKGKSYILRIVWIISERIKDFRGRGCYAIYPSANYLWRSNPWKYFPQRNYMQNKIQGRYEYSSNENNYQSFQMIPSDKIAYMLVRVFECMRARRGRRRRLVWARVWVCVCATDADSTGLPSSSPSPLQSPPLGLHPRINSCTLQACLQAPSSP